MGKLAQVISMFAYINSICNCIHTNVILTTTERANYNGDSKMGRNKRLSPNDPNSFSNPEIVKVEHMHLKWDVNFSKKIISGNILYRLKAVGQPVEKVVFDTRTLNILKVTDANGKPLKFTSGESQLNFGRPLTIDVASLFEKVVLGPVEIRVYYETDPESSALQWLEKEQTAGKKHPYLFSQCEMIQARSLLPCQDTPFAKSTYSSEVTVPKDLQALMSGVIQTDQSSTSSLGGHKTDKFEQKIPIPSYLIAIAVGNIKSKKIGPRTSVWAEPEFLEASAYEFIETEEMLKAAEDLMGEYVWGTYDILVLPPSFSMGGMENPNLTFATPTLLAGDRSLANVIVHEIAHSWTGNLVTNKNFEHFWLNEGFTVFAERKILAKLKGESFRHFTFIGGWKDLSDVIETMKPDNPMTKLVTNLTGLDPDEFFSVVPYEKGSVFLFILEQTVGEPAFEAFFKYYIQSNRFKSIETDDFKNMFTNYFTKLGLSDKISNIDWNAWLYSPGMPIIKPDYDYTLADGCTLLKNKWLEWKATEISPFSKTDFQSFVSPQIIEFLAQLLDEKSPIGTEKVKEMQNAYDFNGYKNCEIRFRWLRLCLRAKWKDQVPLALKFVTEQGRLKYLKPIYRELYDWEETRNQAINNFKKNRNAMMTPTAFIIAKVLHV